jgi:purine nucleosidase
MYATVTSKFGRSRVYAWDVLTLSYFLWPDLFESCVARVDVVDRGESQGRTIRCDTGRDVTLLTAVKSNMEWEERLVSVLAKCSI